MNKEDKLKIHRHSLAHLMATAVLEMFPEAKIGIGPDIEHGFYYDFDLPRTLIPEDLPLIEKRMKELIKENHQFEKEVIQIDKALTLFEKAGQDYKIALIKDLKNDGETEVTIYKTGNFVDLCRGPHVESSGEIDFKSFKLDKIAGAYWRGDEKNKMLQRIYALAFENGKELRKFEALLIEAEKRDHKKIGKEQHLFMTSKYGPGFPLFLNNGLIVWDELLKLWKEVHNKYNYQEIKTPIMFDKSLWETSGHWNYYRENMFTSTIDEQTYVIKPMNCPGGMLAYQNEIHSYKEFPLKIAEIGLVHRYEKSGVLNGLLRVRAFHQDDAHIYMTEDQVTDQILEVLDIVDEMYSVFDLKYHLELSTRPDKSIGSDEAWDMSTKKLTEALEKSGHKYNINDGDGAFYGPKIDVHLEDALGRTWQCATIQVDMNLPERFDLTYVDEDGQKKRPIMIHRVIYGAVERFLGILIEHYAGAFPLWLSPVQIKLLSVSEKFEKEANELADKFKEASIRIEVDNREESVGKKIAEAITSKAPYMIILGEREIKSGKLAVRKRGEKNTEEYEFDSFVEKIREEISSRK
ncbi:threonine--tRNA ligase [Patescibacteria group bacterium]|nr:threonine--tRNA ligase [Patescibacteria group bacterium]